VRCGSTEEAWELFLVVGESNANMEMLGVVWKGAGCMFPGPQPTAYVVTFILSL